MAKKAAPVSQNKLDAMQARIEAAESGGILELWQMPRESFNVAGVPVFETPDDLWHAAVAYFMWATNNDMIAEREVTFNRVPVNVEISKPRPFHEMAFRNFCGISRKQWARLLSLEEFEHVTERIEEIIYLQKFNGGMIGIYNSSMTVRDLALTEKTSIEGPEGLPVGASPLDVVQARMDRLRRAEQAAADRVEALADDA